MKFAEYMTLKKRAEDVGIKDLSALKQLRTIIQVHEVVKSSR